MTTSTPTDFRDDQLTDDVAPKKNDAMDALLAMGGIPAFKKGEVVEGMVIKKDRSTIYVDLGVATAIIYGREFQIGRNMLRSTKEGDPISAKIVELENEDGYIELSVSDADREKRWGEVKEIKEKGELITLKCLEANKGGLVFDYKGMKAFLPVSQLSSEHYPRVEGGDKSLIQGELQKFIGEEMAVVVLDYDVHEEKLILSEKATTPDEIRAKLEKYKTGDDVDGEVSGIVEFGIFVKIEDGLEGLVHISEIDWSLVEDPSTVCAVGDKVRVKVIGIEGDKISLSLKALKPDPWKEANYQKGDIVEGRVTKLTRIGAFVQLMDQKRPAIDGKIHGLSHISEFGNQQKMEAVVEQGKVYPFQIALYDSNTHKLSLLFLGNEGKAKTTREERTEKKEETRPAKLNKSEAGEKKDVVEAIKSEDAAEKAEASEGKE